MTRRRRRHRAVWVAAGIAAAAALLVAGRMLPLREWLTSFSGFVRGLGVAGAVLYGLLYVAAALLFAPGLLLTLGAGYLFGVAWGVVLVSIASTAAAALGFLIARHLARAKVRWLTRRYPQFAAIDRAIEKEGWRVVALLRLSPLIPFSVSNYLYGLTAIPLRSYVLASWLAMLPATILYVSIGAAGASLDRGRARSPFEWALLAAGIAATLAVTVLLARRARKELKQSVTSDR